MISIDISIVSTVSTVVFMTHERGELPPMSRRSSARKGADAEREVQRIFATHGYALKRDGTETFGAVPDLYGADGLHLEIKRCERLSLLSWLAQSERDAEAFCDGVPTVIFRQSRQPWRIVLPLETFLSEYYCKVHPPNN